MEILPYGRDERLLERCRRSGEPQIELYRPERAEVVLGRGSRAELELNLEACRASGALLRRRLGGGCAVVLDPGNLVLSAALPMPGVGGVSGAYETLLSWVIEGLASAGLAGVERAGSRDLALAGRKVGGTCVYRAKDILFFSTTLLVSPDLDAVARWIAPPPREPEYRAGRDHAEFMGSLDPDGDAEAWLPKLRGVFTAETLPRAAV